MAHVSASNEQRRSVQIQSFLDEFKEFIGTEVEYSYFRTANFYKLLLRILNISADKILMSSGSDLIFQPLTSFRYQDGQPMMTVCGILINRCKANSLINDLKAWKYINSSWQNPMKIDVPTLSLKERLTLNQALPVKTNSVKMLKRKLGFEIGDSDEEYERQLRQYADFYKYYPYFSQVVI